MITTSGQTVKHFRRDVGWDGDCVVGEAGQLNPMDEMKLDMIVLHDVTENHSRSGRGRFWSFVFPPSSSWALILALAIVCGGAIGGGKSHSGLFISMRVAQWFTKVRLNNKGLL